MRFMGGVERIGNKLPHPFYLFALLAILAVVLSVIFNGASVTYEVASSSGDAATTATATVKNLLNRDTIGYVITSLYKIYFNFSPMMMIGLLTLTIGLCEQVGLFDAVIRKTILGAKPALIFAIVSFIAFQSNMASSAGILGCTTVAASLFASLGYNPWLGIILAYAAGNAGMFANVFPGQMDVLLVGVTQSVCASLGLDGTSAHVLMNWFFMLPCAVVLTVVYTLITTKFTSRFMGPPKDLSLIKIEPQEKAENTNESRALRKTAIATVLFFVVLIVACIPKNSFLRSADGTLFPASPLMSGILTLMFLFFLVVGLVFGRAVGKNPTWNTLPKLFANSIGTLANFMVIALPASLFIYLFNESGIPTVLGVTGAQFLKSSGINGFGLLICIALFSTFLNLFMTSGISKWMILAPILIPMFYAIGFSPALTTMAYRIGDASTNAIAPISTDIALILALLTKYNTDKDKTPGIGTVMAGCLPYAVATFVIGLLILAVFWILKLPLGPGSPLFV